MRQRLTIILTVLVVVGVLVIINIVTYVKQENARDSELTPNRSTYHSGPTGTRALYDFLSESGYPVMRWREPTAKLLGQNNRNVATFVVIGPTQAPITDNERQELSQWVLKGGRLVVIDRSPPDSLMPKSGDWRITTTEAAFPSINTDPGSPKEMTQGVLAIQPSEPTPLTEGVQSVLPSRFAAHIYSTTSPASDAELKPATTSKFSPAPVVHFQDRYGGLLVDYLCGNGRIVVLSDPYFVSNGGINLKDNLQLAVNTLAGSGGLIAFDEYHQGRALTGNPFASYFAGTPIIAIAVQLAVLIVFVLWTRGRRFARPLPLPQVDRRSSLEFVASMAELQERSRAFDLAIENIYSRTRRALARFAGVEYNSPRSAIASRVAQRSELNTVQLEILMRQCEEVINGGPNNWKHTLNLVRRLREVERKLGLQMRSRDVRQAAEHF